MRVSQGCLLYMLLCIIVIEVLAIFINTDKMIKGIRIRDHEIKIVNFADYTTISLWDITYLKMVQLILILYENAKINYLKVNLTLLERQIEFLLSKIWYRGQTYTTPKYIKKEIEKRTYNFLWYSKKYNVPDY